MRAKVCTPQGKEKQIVFKTLSVEISEVGELCVASFMGTTPWRGNLPILSPHLHTLPVVCVCVCMCVCVAASEMSCGGGGKGKDCLRNQYHVAEMGALL